MAESDLPTPAAKRLRRPLFLTRLGLFAERATRAFSPLWSILFVTAAALMLGMLGMLCELAAPREAKVLPSFASFSRSGLQRAPSCSVPDKARPAAREPKR